MMAALMRIPPTGSTHQPFFHSIAMRAITIAAELLCNHTGIGKGYVDASGLMRHCVQSSAWGNRHPAAHVKTEDLGRTSSSVLFKI